MAFGVYVVLSCGLLFTSVLHAQTGDDVTDLVDATSQFATRLYLQLAQSRENLFFSPHSVSLALAMTYAGAAGNTKAQLDRVLGFEGLDGDVTRVGSEFSDLMTLLSQKSDDYTLVEANRLFGQQDYTFRQQFLDLLDEDFDSQLQRVNFADADLTRAHVNEWVANNTQQKILDLIGPGDIDATTVLLLINAIYFKANWKVEFNEELTEDGKFYLTENTVIEVPMMSTKGQFEHARSEELQCNILRLPYNNDQAAMMILLPIGSLEDTEQRLSEHSLREVLDSEITGETSGTDINVKLPKFKITHQQSLKDPLVNIGIIDLFSDGTADLSGMDEANNLYVGDVLHQAFVEVNEQGTEASAATSVAVHFKMATPAMNINKPFMFVIQDTATRDILFMGRVVNPSTTVMSRRSALTGSDSNDGDNDGSTSNDNAAVMAAKCSVLSVVLFIVAAIVMMH